MPKPAPKRRAAWRYASRNMSTGYLLFLAWQDAAAAWERLRSDPAEARCRAARAAYYAATLGYVPPLTLSA